MPWILSTIWTGHLGADILPESDDPVLIWGLTRQRLDETITTMLDYQEAATHLDDHPPILEILPPLPMVAFVRPRLNDTLQRLLGEPRISVEDKLCELRRQQRAALQGDDPVQRRLFFSAASSLRSARALGMLPPLHKVQVHRLFSQRWMGLKQDSLPQLTLRLHFDDCPFEHKGISLSTLQQIDQWMDIESKGG